MTPEIISLTPLQALGIPIALVAAVFLALGTQFQHRGVGKVEAALGSGAKAGLNVRQLRALITRPSWVLGTALLGIAVLMQLVSIGIAPLTVVQPLGAVALVITAIVNSRVSRIPLDRITIRAIVMCVGGIALFVVVAAMVAESPPVRGRELIIVLVLLGVVLAFWAIAFALVRKKASPIFYILGAGVLFGFVVTLAKVVIARVQTLLATGFEWETSDLLTILCLMGLAAAGLLGTYFVQTAHSTGPPDLVVAGLTVIDPLVAVSIGVIVLGEARDVPLYASIPMVVGALVAIWGVVLLARHHPQVRN